MYDPVIGRWMSVDPARQYASGYLAMRNNPILYYDPNGLWDWNAIKKDAMYTTFGGLEVAGGVSVITASSGLGTIPGAYLVADGSVRVIAGLNLLYHGITEDNVK
ncbi:hypothetical protein EI427_10050 [Flammeovirga pectinis]|uniref:RHS repeat-associated core domain-containing protein n=1 Tax=Flammeovirga pectinis TaxID=2494373 RepID=A0A3S9P312_9BACT|nr:hypothetical protein EI427_10050 [Flammeovirga pectinis]